MDETLHVLSCNYYVKVVRKQDLGIIQECMCKILTDYTNGKHFNGKQPSKYINVHFQSYS